MLQKLFVVRLHLISSAALYICAFGVSGNYSNLLAFDGNQQLDEPKLVSDTFETNASSFLHTYCIDCHGPDTQEADLRFDQIGHDLSDSKTAQIWSDIFAQVQFREMPPSDSDQPSAEQRSRFVKLIEAELARFNAGFGLKEKMLLPQYGNYVDHNSLFDG
ncbi:hypothetical protein N9B31_10115, partial [Mariniblastus sp.]|nr:hypothetical protein [Mariniblastus sp.]